jgi:3-hydroxyacyl-CoA dehydrogenase
MAEVMHIAVVGAGSLGHRIAQEGLMAGYTVVLNDVGQASEDMGAESVRERLSRCVDSGLLSQDEYREMLSRLVPAHDLKMTVSGAHLVIEAISEDLYLRKKLFAYLDRYAPPDAILATSASSMSISAIGEATMRAEKVVGMHFFNLPAMKLVEVVYGKASSTDAVSTACGVAKKMGKVPVIVRKDSPGFIFNRVNAPARLLLQLILEKGQPSPQDFDAALKPFMPMTPFELADYVGIDTMLQEQGYFARTLSPDYRPRKALRELVAEGHLGRKTGRGIFDWSSGRPAIDTSHPTREYNVDHIIALQVNESTKLLEEAVAQSPGDIDLALANGGGGAGPFTLAKGIGYPRLIERCEELAYKFAIDAFNPTQTMKGLSIDIEV